MAGFCTLLRNDKEIAAYCLVQAGFPVPPETPP